MSEPRRSPLRLLRVAAWCFAGALSFGALSTIAPDTLTPNLAKFGSSTAFPYSQLLDFPIMTGVTLALLGIIFLGVGVWRVRAGGTAALLVFGLAAGLAGGVHIYRAVDAGLKSPPRVVAAEATSAPTQGEAADGEGATDGAKAEAEKPEGENAEGEKADGEGAAEGEGAAPAAPTRLVLAQLNVEGDTAVHDAIVRDLVRAAPDVVVIANAGEGYAQALADKMVERKLGPFDIQPTTGNLFVISNTATTNFRVASTGSISSDQNLSAVTQGGALVLTDGAGTSLYAVAVAERDRKDMAPFQRDIAAVGSMCGNSGLIVVGDLSTSMASGPLKHSQCRDAATELGHGAAGTWPASVPAWLGVPRAHVLLSGDNAWQPESIASFEIPRSAHRGLVVTLSR